MLFDVAGPFEIERHGRTKIIIERSRKDLRPILEDWEEGLSSACGCYVFALRAGRGFTPYYVGQACKRTLLDEALNPANPEKYNTALGNGKGTPVLFLVPMRTPNGRFRKRTRGNTGLKELDFLEFWLLANAIDKNPDLINNKQTRFLRNLRVIGFLNAERGELTTASRFLSRALWR